MQKEASSFSHSASHIQLCIFPNLEPYPKCLPIFNIYSDIFYGENAYMQEIPYTNEKATSICMLHVHFQNDNYMYYYIFVLVLKPNSHFDLV